MIINIILGPDEKLKLLLSGTSKEPQYGHTLESEKFWFWRCVYMMRILYYVDYESQFIDES